MYFLYISIRPTEALRLLEQLAFFGKWAMTQSRRICCIPTCLEKDQLTWDTTKWMSDWWWWWGFCGRATCRLCGNRDFESLKRDRTHLCVTLTRMKQPMIKQSGTISLMAIISLTSQVICRLRWVLQKGKWGYYNKARVSLCSSLQVVCWIAHHMNCSLF